MFSSAIFFGSAVNGLKYKGKIIIMPNVTNAYVLHCIKTIKEASFFVHTSHWNLSPFYYEWYLLDLKGTEVHPFFTMFCLSGNLKNRDLAWKAHYSFLILFLAFWWSFHDAVDCKARQPEPAFLLFFIFQLERYPQD